jgi:hypothetical protein
LTECATDWSGAGRELERGAAVRAVDKYVAVHGWDGKLEKKVGVELGFCRRSEWRETMELVVKVIKQEDAEYCCYTRFLFRNFGYILFYMVFKDLFDFVKFSQK